MKFYSESISYSSNGKEVASEEFGGVRGVSVNGLMILSATGSSAIALMMEPLSIESLRRFRKNEDRFSIVPLRLPPYSFKEGTEPSSGSSMRCARRRAMPSARFD